MQPPSPMAAFKTKKIKYMKKKSKKVNDLYTLFIHNKDGIKKEYTASIFNETVQYFVKSGFMPEYGFDIGRIECEINNLNEKVTIIHDLNIEGIEIKYQNGTFHKSLHLLEN